MYRVEREREIGESVCVQREGERERTFVYIGHGERERESVFVYRESGETEEERKSEALQCQVHLS